MQLKPLFAKLTNSISWTMFSSTSSPSILAELINLATPPSLSLGHGFFRITSSESSILTKALYDLGNSLNSFTFGSFDTSGGHTSSDFISHHLTKWHALTRLELQNVAFGNVLEGGPFPLLLANMQWQKYNPPTFRLKHLGIVWTGTSSEERWKLEPVTESSTEETAIIATTDAEEQGNTKSTGSSTNTDWISWLLSSSTDTLTSLKLVGLSCSLPDTTLSTLQHTSRHLQNLQITDYRGPELIADMLLYNAQNLLTLTLGGETAIVDSEDGSSLPTLATSACLQEKHKLRCLEIQNLLLFDRLQVQQLLNEGELSALRQINLLNASRVYHPVQRLVLSCRGTDMTIVIRPPMSHRAIWEL